MITNFDGQILLWIQENLRTEALTPIVVFITKLGNSGLFWIAATVLLLCIPKTRKAGSMAALALICTFLINNIVIKNLVARPRPWTAWEELEILIDKPGGHSFPSGHTANSFAAAVMMFKTLPSYIGIPAVILAAMIGFSRLYLGVHYPTDVLVGAIVGTAIALIAHKIVVKKQEESHVKR